MKKQSKYILPLILISFLVYLAIKSYKRVEYDDEIKKSGKYCIAVIIGKMVTKGNVGYIKYKYSYNIKEFGFEDSASDSFYKQHKVGDTIIIRVLPSDPSQSLMMENIKYDKSFGKQPVDGWEKLP